MTDPVAALASAGSLFTTLSNGPWVAETLKRAGTVALGVLLLILGFVIMIEGTKTGRTVTGAAVKLAGTVAA